AACTDVAGRGWAPGRAGARGARVRCARGGGGSADRRSKAGACDGDRQRTGHVTWDPELDELRRRTELAAAMGGEEKVARQHDAGKLAVRERIDALVDPGSFHARGAH